MGQREPMDHGEEEDNDKQSQMATVRPWARGGEHRRGGFRRGRGVQGEGDDEDKTLDMLTRAKTTRGRGAEARGRPRRDHSEQSA